MLNDWSHKVRAILKKYCPACHDCHKARGILDFNLATKSSVWIIMCFIVFNNECPMRMGTSPGSKSRSESRFSVVTGKFPNKV